MRCLKTEIPQSINTIRFLVTILGTIFVLLISCSGNLITLFRSTDLLNFNTHIDLIMSAMGGEAIALALPIISALPYTTAYVDDTKSGYIKVYLSRIGVERYVISKALSCALSGGLAILMGAVVSYILLALMLLPIEAAPTIVSSADKVKSLSPIWGKFALLFASGCFWSMVGLMLASVTKSRYMAYIGPFVVCYILIILYERYFDFLYVLYPREWLNPSDKWVLGAWGVAILLIVLTGVIGCIFAYWARRQLVQE